MKKIKKIFEKLCKQGEKKIFFTIHNTHITMVYKMLMVFFKGRETFGYKD